MTIVADPAPSHPAAIRTALCALAVLTIVAVHPTGWWRPFAARGLITTAGARSLRLVRWLAAGLGFAVFLALMAFAWGAPGPCGMEPICEARVEVRAMILTTVVATIVAVNPYAWVRSIDSWGRAMKLPSSRLPSNAMIQTVRWIAAFIAADLLHLLLAFPLRGPLSP